MQNYKIITIAFIFCLCSSLDNARSQSILRTDKVWSASAHNAFTDLIWHQDHFVLAFREGVTHGVPNPGTEGGKIRVLQSSNGLSWTSAAVIQGGSNDDLRDAKLSITPDNRIMLTAAAAFKTNDSSRQSRAWFSSNGGTNWTTSSNIGDLNRWLWGTAWNGNQVYSVGYGPTPSSNDQRNTILYRGTTGTDFQQFVPGLTSGAGLPGGGETALLFRSNGTAVALSRRDTGDFSSLIGTSSGDFSQWTWHNIPERIGGPELIELPDHRIVAATRRFDTLGNTRTSLGWIDPDAGTMSEFLVLPSGGDTSYAGMVWHDEKLFVSYYSSHEGKASIYVSQVSIPLLIPEPSSWIIGVVLCVGFVRLGLFSRKRNSSKRNN